MKKRHITEYEIQDILSFITPQKGIPKESAISIANTNKQSLYQQLKIQKIYPSMIPKLKTIIERQYNISKIQPGESVGVIGAQSMGEKQTQTTLNTFHRAGTEEKMVTTGVPRLEELLNATRDPKSVNCVVKLKTRHNSIAEMRKTIGHNVVEITFKKITKSFDICINKKKDDWYNAYDIIYGNEYSKYNDCISLNVDMDLLYKYKLKLKSIGNIIHERYGDMRCVFSPDNIGKLDIYVDTSKIELPVNRDIFMNSENVKEIYLEEVVHPILNNIIICGVPGIKEIYFNSNFENFETNGSNLPELFALPFVDSTQTISNNVWNIYNTLGIEAARQCLMEEMMNILKGINKCHVQLLVEKMTHSGTISSVSRYSMRTEKCGPLGKASFEETMDNCLLAGVYGQDEKTTGISASIICGKVAKIGTGLCDLKINIAGLQKIVKDKVVSETDEQYI